MGCSHRRSRTRSIEEKIGILHRMDALGIDTADIVCRRRPQGSRATWSDSAAPIGESR